MLPKTTKFAGAILIMASACSSPEETGVPPNVRITAPLNGSEHFGEVAVAIEADGENLDRVELFIDGIHRATLEGVGFDFIWHSDEEQGNKIYNLFAVGYNEAGLSTTSDTITVGIQAFDGWWYYDSSNSPLGHNLPVNFEFDNHSMWIATMGQGLYRFSEPDNWVNYIPPNSPFSSVYLKDLQWDGANLWALSDNELIRWREDLGWILPPVRPPENGQIFRAFRIDPAGYRWLTIQGGALFRYDGFSFAAYPTVFDGSEQQYIYEGWRIKLDVLGDIWVAHSGGVIKITKNTWEEFDHLNSPLWRSDEFRQLAIDGKGRVWVSGAEGGLAILENNEWSVTPYPVPMLLYSMSGDASGGVWLGGQESGFTGPATLFGLLEGGTVQFDATNAPIKNIGYISAIKQADDGTLWIGGWYRGSRGGMVARWRSTDG